MITESFSMALNRLGEYMRMVRKQRAIERILEQPFTGRHFLRGSKWSDKQIAAMEKRNSVRLEFNRIK